MNELRVKEAESLPRICKNRGIKTSQVARLLKNPSVHAGDIRYMGSIPAWVRKLPCRRKWPPTPVFLPGESHGQRRLVGYSSKHHRVEHDWAHMHLQARIWTHTLCLHIPVFMTTLLSFLVNSFRLKKKFAHIHTHCFRENTNATSLQNKICRKQQDWEDIN